MVARHRLSPTSPPLGVGGAAQPPALGRRVSAVCAQPARSAGLSRRWGGGATSLSGSTSPVTVTGRWASLREEPSTLPVAGRSLNVRGAAATRDAPPAGAGLRLRAACAASGARSGPFTCGAAAPPPSSPPWPRAARRLSVRGPAASSGAGSGAGSGPDRSTAPRDLPQAPTAPPPIPPPRARCGRAVRAGV